MAGTEDTYIMPGDELEMQNADNLMPTAGQEKGIDVSNWQGKIDWAKVAKAGVKHVCMKMSEGASYVDLRFVENWNGAKKACINVICYHYFRALGSSAQQQMQNIKKNMAAVGFDPAKNILGNENATPVQMADGLMALLSLIKKDSVLSHRPVMIYTSYGYWDSKVKWDKYNFAVYPIWVAHWRAQAPRLPQPWMNSGKIWAFVAVQRQGESRWHFR